MKMTICKYYIIFIIVLLNQTLFSYSMSDPAYKEIIRGSNSKIKEEKIRLIINQNELKEFCKEVGIEEINYEFKDEYQSLLFCFSGNSNSKDDLVKITSTRQHSLDLADMTVHLNRSNKSDGIVFQPFIVYEIRALRRPDQFTSQFILDHHNLSNDEISAERINCELARMLKYHVLFNDGKTFKPEELTYQEKLNAEDLKFAFKKYFGDISIEDLKTSLGNDTKHDPLLLKNITQSAGWDWYSSLSKEEIKKRKLTIKDKLTIKHKDKTIEFDVYQIQARWYEKTCLINIAFAKEQKQGIIYITNIQTEK